MSFPRLRPRFEMELPLTAAEAVARLRARLAEDGCPCRGMVADQQRHVDLRVHRAEQHLWSPALAMEIRDREEGGSRVHALVGPNPSVWTMVAFSQLALITAALFLFTLGGVQLLLDRPPWALAAGGAALLLVAAVWLAARIGQRLAAPQTALLRRFLEESFEAGGAAR
jgi:hypothetical protein